MRGEIAGVILPAVKSCRDGTNRDLRFWILDLRRGGKSRKVRGEIAGGILPAVKSCRSGTDRDLRFGIYEESNIICFSAKNRVNFATSGLRVNFTPLRGELISAGGGENFACWRVGKRTEITLAVGGGIC